jgi:indoleamine 2,3-dioxygenase
MTAPRCVAALVRTSYESDLGPAGAFLPGRVPIRELPPPLARFTDACDELSSRYSGEHGGVRSWLDQVFRRDSPEVSRAVARLDGAETEALHTALCVLGHTYRWDTVPPAPERFGERTIPLPLGISVPWRALAQAMDVPQVGSVWTLHLTNWTMRDRSGGAPYRPDELCASNVAIARSWLASPVDRDLENFSTSFVLLEAEGAAALKALVDAIECAGARWVEGTAAGLLRLRAAIATMTRAFAMNVRRRTVDPAIWLELIQPTFAWAAYSGQSPPVEGGPSGMQLGTIQALDAALCVKGRSALAQLAASARRHMPPAHRRFLAALDAAGPVLRNFVAGAGSPELTEGFDGCVAALTSFRVTHRARGTQYLAGRPSSEVPRASTGLTIGIRDDPLATFERSMTERIVETRAAMSCPTPGMGTRGASCGRNVGAGVPPS